VLNHDGMLDVCHAQFQRHYRPTHLASSCY
jgi:hypothetical protein